MMWGALGCGLSSESSHGQQDLTILHKCSLCQHQIAILTSFPLLVLVLCITVTFADRGVTAAGFVACVFLFVFNTCFAFGWLGSTWLYPAEITSLAIRSQANGFSTVSNWRKSRARQAASKSKGADERAGS